jgi:CheY-like chemotaxis protein
MVLMHCKRLSKRSQTWSFLDFSMPVMNGVEAARVFNQIMPEVPVLMLSAHAGAADEAAKNAGVLGVFAKDNVAPLVKQTRTLLKLREG